MACGYPDANDSSDRLGDDPIQKLLLGRDPIIGEALASQPTVSRSENAVHRRALYHMGRELAATVIERHRRRPHGRARRITIDLDPTDDLSDLFLAKADRQFGSDATSTARAYELLSRLGGVLFLLEVATLLVIGRWSRRVCRVAALALAAPLTVTFFGYYENGYLAACVVAFPLLAIAAVRRSLPALHGFGIIGIGGGVLAALTVARQRWPRWSAAVQFAAFATTTYLGWVFVYTVVLKISILVRHTRTDAGLLFRPTAVCPLTTWTGIAEVGAASMSAGVPALAGVLAASASRARITRMAVAFALPALAFLIVWWPSLGVRYDMDLFLGAFSAIGAAAWLGSRRPGLSWYTLALLALCHLAMWSTIGGHTLDRVWIKD